MCGWAASTSLWRARLIPGSGTIPRSHGRRNGSTHRAGGRATTASTHGSGAGTPSCRLAALITSRPSASAQRSSTATSGLRRQGGKTAMSASTPSPTTCSSSSRTGSPRRSSDSPPCCAPARSSRCRSSPVRWWVTTMSICRGRSVLSGSRPAPSVNPASGPDACCSQRASATPGTASLASSPSFRSSMSGTRASRWVSWASMRCACATRSSRPTTIRMRWKRAWCRTVSASSRGTSVYAPAVGAQSAGATTA